MFYFVMVALWMLAYVLTQQVVHSKYAQFFIRNHQKTILYSHYSDTKIWNLPSHEVVYKKTQFIFLISSSAPFLPSLCSRHTGCFFVYFL